MPTDGETPRASQTAQTMMCASPTPRTEDALVALDFRPDAVVGRLREVPISDWVKAGVDVDMESAVEYACCCLFGVVFGADLDV